MITVNSASEIQKGQELKHPQSPHPPNQTRGSSALRLCCFVCASAVTLAFTLALRTHYYTDHELSFHSFLTIDDLLVYIYSPPLRRG